MAHALFRYDNELQHADLVQVDGENTARDETFETALVISWGTNAPALDGSTGDGRAGWWGDRFYDTPIGDRTWSISQGGTQESRLALARRFSREALLWMVTDGIAADVTVAVSSPSTGVLERRATITRADGSQWDAIWRATHEAF